MKRLLFLLAVPVLCAAGCSSGSSPSVAWVAPSASSVSPSASAPTAKKTTKPKATKTGPVPAGDVLAAASHCRTKDLRASLGTAKTVGSTIYQPLVLTNRSGKKCSLAGYPGVTWLDAGGKAVNEPFGSVPRETPAEIVNLKSGASAHATLIYQPTSKADAASCVPVKVSGYQVTPPGESTSITVEASVKACSASGVNTGRVQSFESGRS